MWHSFQVHLKYPINFNNVQYTEYWIYMRYRYVFLFFSAHSKHFLSPFNKNKWQMISNIIKHFVDGLVCVHSSRCDLCSIFLLLLYITWIILCSMTCMTLYIFNWFQSNNFPIKNQNIYTFVIVVIIHLTVAFDFRFIFCT